MAYYAQKNYNQELGNGKYTIAQAGCLLTATCNLKLRLSGSAPDPATLNNWFKQNNLYLRDSDSALEDLAWNSITKVDPTIVLKEVGASALPPSDVAIVKFHYVGRTTGQPLDHFCAVDRIENGQLFIADSYDGLVKSPQGYEGYYGKPVAWAIYDHVVAPASEAPSAPKSQAPAAPVPIPGNSQNTFQVVTGVPGYRTSGTAASRTGATVTVEPGSYFVYNQFNGMVNVTKKPGTPGAWINPGDNVAPPPPNTDPAKFTVKQVIPGYMTSNDAANHINQTVHVGPGEYFVFNEAHNMVNVTVKSGVPGAWINPTDNEAAPAPAPAPAPAATEAAPAEVPAPTPDWQKTYKANPESFIAIKDIMVRDLSGQKAPIKLKQYDLVNLAGTFKGPDGTLYGRTQTSVNNGWWYAIPMDVLELEQDVFNVTTDITTRKAVNSLQFRDRLVIYLANLTGWIERFGNKNKQQQKPKVASKE